MVRKRFQLSKKSQAVIRLIAAVVLNLGIVFSAVYILFHLLDYYNPHGFIRHNLPWLPIGIAVLFLLSVLLYDFLIITGAFKKQSFHKARFMLFVLCDLILFAVISITLYFSTCTNCLVEHNSIEVHDLPTPVTNAVPVTPISEAITDEPGSDEIDLIPDPQAQATPAPTAIPIPLNQKFPDRFSETPSVQSYDQSNVVETLSDGTKKSLIYSYSGRNASVTIYHYKKGKLEYQLADIYVRDVDCFTTNFSVSFKHNKKTQTYAANINAIVAVNGDNFNSGKIEDGIVIRNGAQLYPKDGAKQTRFSRDLCVLFSDGSIQVYDCIKDRIDYDEILSRYPRQAFYFGPKLLNDDGTAMTKFNSTLSKINPRTALGYYEPGHYAFLVVLGTREIIDYRGKSHGNGKSPGMTLTELSALCEQLGFRMAYNLDGGGSSSMVWNKTVFGHNDRTHSDILAIVDP